MFTRELKHFRVSQSLRMRNGTTPTSVGFTPPGLPYAAGDVVNTPPWRPVAMAFRAPPIPRQVALFQDASTRPVSGGMAQCTRRRADVRLTTAGAAKVAPMKRIPGEHGSSGIPTRNELTQLRPCLRQGAMLGLAVGLALVSVVMQIWFF